VLFAAEQLIENLEVLFVQQTVELLIQCNNQAAVVCLVGNESLYYLVMAIASLTNQIVGGMKRNIRTVNGNRRNWRDM
jgi:hypothetical protein